MEACYLVSAKNTSLLLFAIFFAVYSFLSKLSLVCVCLVSEEVPASVGDKKFICGKAGPMIPIRWDETASLVGMISSIAGLKTSS